MDADVVIVGAGLSGLVAARNLARKGRSVIVLEAHDRVGGRTYSRDIDGVRFDVGGQWIGPGQDRVRALADELGLARFKTYIKGDHLLDVGTGLKRYRGIIPPMTVRGLAQIGLAVARTYAKSFRLSKAHDEQTVEDMLHLHTPDARGTFDAAFRVVFGAEPRDISLYWYLFYIRFGGGYFRLVEVEGGNQESRFVRCAHELSLTIARELGDRVRLSTPVTRIVQEGNQVRVNDLTARRAIVAIPPSLLSNIAFEPAPPRERTELTSKMAMGSTVKMIATYDKPFWREKGLSGQVVSGTGPLSIVFDNTTHDGSVASLVGFIVARDGRTWRPERENEVRAQLASWFGEEARTPRSLVIHDWSQEPWVKGCPVNSPPPRVMGTRHDSLRTPHGAVHWAGTETATRNAGFLDGAVSAGERAAEEVLRAL